MYLRPDEKSVTDAGMADAFGSDVQHMIVRHVPERILLTSCYVNL